MESGRQTSAQNCRKWLNRWAIRYLPEQAIASQCPGNWTRAVQKKEFEFGWVFGRIECPASLTPNVSKEC
jgi:hypothetical protein